jgi:hypothetical protein
MDSDFLVSRWKRRRQGEVVKVLWTGPGLEGKKQKVGWE